MGYALMLLLIGLYLVIRGLPERWVGERPGKENGRPL